MGITSPTGAVGKATVAVASILIAAVSTIAARATPAVPPSAAEFAEVFAGVSNAYAREHGDPTRVANVHCVQASPGRYMCSYAVLRPAATKDCHLMQATWTPARLSSFTVTLSGRVRRCASLRDALRSLR